MKRYLSIVFTLIMAATLFSACTGEQPETPVKPETKTPAVTPAPTPDYTHTDFTGIWYVSAVFASDGSALNADEMQTAGAGFTLELLENGVYYIYDAQSTALGKGEYRVSDNRLTCSAAGQNTVYDIEDADTLRCTAQDSSVTVMSRQQAEPTNDEETEPDTAEETGASPDNDTEEDTDAA